MITWEPNGDYEEELDWTIPSYTGWYRLRRGRLADGRWPQWHRLTGYCIAPVVPDPLGGRELQVKVESLLDLLRNPDAHAYPLKHAA